MDGERLEHNIGQQEQASFYKVGHPRMSNNIIQMRSKGFQAPFYAGAMSCIPYYLGMEHNAIEHRISRDYLSPTQRIIMNHKCCM
jgi:hypothetical protein